MKPTPSLKAKAPQRLLVEKRANRKRKKLEKQRKEDIACIIKTLDSFLIQCKLTFSSYSEDHYLKDHSELVIRMESEGIGFAAKTLPNLAKGLLEYLETGKGNFQGFALKASKYPHFLSGLFRLVFCKNKNVDAIRMIYQIGSSFKKLKGTYPDDVLEQQLADFIAVDESLVLEFKEPDEMIISHARAFIEKLFKGVSEEDFLSSLHPRPGPGATNAPTHYSERFRPKKIYRQIEEVFPPYDWFYSNYHEFVWDIPNYKKLLRDDEPTSRFEFVPKTYGKARGICIEENEMQFMQQGVKQFLYDHIENHPLTKGKINFTDQSVNAHLALASSASRQLATLDMKEASDRISRRLVELLFQDIPFLQEALLALSTRTITLPKGNLLGVDSIRSNKYAPMGSGLCFPVMSLVHYSLIRSILYLSMHDDDLMNDIYVYGDDIILPSETAQAVFDWLPRFGMKFNETKSFVRGLFRESCGIHAYNGVDITPVYFKYTIRDWCKPTVLQSLISNEYDLWNRGYWTVARFLRCETNLERFVHPQTNVVGWKRPPILQYNFCGVKKRWNFNHQSVEYRTKVFKPIGKRYNIACDEALTRWFVLRANDHTNLLDADIVTYDTTWTSHWKLVC